MNTYKCTLEYDGSDYFGWQIQSGGEKTIQGELNRALKKIVNSSEIQTIGSGRTDKGVHALGQVVKIILPVPIPKEGLSKALNSELHSSIRAIEINSCDEDFQPVFDCKKKQYDYLFSLNELDVFSRRYVSIAPKDLNIELLQEGLDLFLGEHDFCNYFCVGTPVKSTIREIFDISLSTTTCNSYSLVNDASSCFKITVIGNGFLKQMVRLIIGAWWALGCGKVDLKTLKESLKRPMSKRLGVVAPANGLYLVKAWY